MSQRELAELSGFSRDYIAQVEVGRIKSLRPEVATVLAGRVKRAPEAIEREFAEWVEAPSTVDLPPRARNTLALPVHVVAQYDSFSQWRRDITPSLYRFSVLTRVAHSTLRRYEKEGGRMPANLYRALVRHFGLSRDYVGVLQRLGEKE